MLTFEAGLPSKTTRSSRRRRSRFLAPHPSPDGEPSTHAQLKTLKEQLADFYEFAPIGYLSLSTTGRILATNSTACQQLGLDRTLLVGMSFVVFVHRGDLEKFLTYQSRVLQERCRLSCELRLSLAGRAEIVVLMESISVPAGTTAPTQYRAALIDITPLKAAEAALHASRSLYFSLMSDAFDAIIVSDTEGCIREVNRRAIEMLTLERRTLEGSSIRTLLSVSSLESFSEAVSRCLERGSAFLPQVMLRASSGKEVPVSIGISLCQMPDASFLSFMVRDISYELQAREELQLARVAAETANRAKSEFLARMSHELRTPLNGIIGATEVLSFEEDPAQRLALLTLLRHSSEHLLGVINDVLDFSKLEAQKIRLAVGEVELLPLLRSVHQLFLGQAKAKGIALRLRIHPDTPTLIQGDAFRLRQILTNLLSNAVKFTQEGSVEVEARILDGAPSLLEISVVDTGIGVPFSQQEHVFEEFFQAGTQVTRDRGGTGLGLSISRGLAHLMGGTLGMNSTPGVGSQFVLRVPLVRRP